MSEFYRLCEEVDHMFGEHLTDVEFRDVVAWAARERGIPTP